VATAAGACTEIACRRRGGFENVIVELIRAQKERLRRPTLIE
jgi:hypothetical protein